MGAQPSIKVTGVWPMTGDEWYGFGARFAWDGEPPKVPDPEEIRAALARDGKPLYWKEPEYERSERARRAFEVAVAEQALWSPEVRAFLAKPHTLSVDINGSDPTQRRVTLPGRYYSDQYDYVQLDAEGGEISWMGRD